MTRPAVIARSLVRARREHRALLARLSRVQRTWLRGTPGSRPGAQRAALPRLFETCERGIGSHLAAEETALYPYLHEQLPEDTGTLDAALREHDTLREVIDLLRQRGERFLSGDTGAAAEIDALLRDLIALWGQHARRIDEVLAPLMNGWPEASRG